MKDEILEKLKDLKSNKIAIVVIGLVIAFFLVVAGSSILQSCSSSSSSSSEEDSGNGSQSGDANSGDSRGDSSPGTDGTATQTNVPKESEDKEVPGAVIPGDQNYKIPPKNQGTGSKYITGPPKNPIPVNKADFPGGFPLAPGVQVISTKNDDRKSTVKFWLADAQGAAKFYADQLTEAQLYVDSQNISVDGLMSYFKFSGDGYGREGGTLTIRGSTATLVWYAPEDVIVPAPKTTETKKPRADKPKAKKEQTTPTTRTQR